MMSIPDGIAIVGAGQAGCSIALELRKSGYSKRIVLFGDEPHAPYQRPPLSKASLSADTALTPDFIATYAGLESCGIEFRGNTLVQHIDRSKKLLSLSDGSMFVYDKLALTTGGRNRGLGLKGCNARNVLSIRTIDDASRLRPYLVKGKRLVVIGGGFIGLEVAAAAADAGLDVTVLESTSRLLSRAAGEVISTFFKGLHERSGVSIRTNALVTQLHGDAHVSEVQLNDGSRLPADVVVVGIGLLPNVDLAERAGLAVHNGIVVDDCARTSDPDIVAAGDCTNYPSKWSGTRVRLESVQNAIEQARTAASTLCGLQRSHRALPWFWSDQYDTRLQTAGLLSGHDAYVVRGDTAAGSFSVFYFRSNTLVACDSVNRPLDHVIARRLIESGLAIEPILLADEGHSLKQFITPPVIRSSTSPSIASAGETI